MNDELYHKWNGKGTQRANHKYTRREWKNGHWVYYYDDGTSEVMKPGQNYLTIEQAKKERDEERKSISERQNKAKIEQEKIVEVSKKIDSWVRKGKEAVEKLEWIWDLTLEDIFEYFKNGKKKRE